MSYCIYLRKSRADLEAESRGEGETLRRHEETLLSLAGKLNLPIGRIYKEIVSGETIAARPEMQQLLSDLENGCWKGVLVMEVERLARGNTLDQGIVAQAFQFSGAKIITPIKIYDPNDEFDEEYFEFGLFMSRREYKTINRRIQRGRVAAFMEGKWIYSTTPYGLRRIKLNDASGYSLEAAGDETTEAVILIKDYTIRYQYGSTKIAHLLNDAGYISATGNKWTPSGVRQIRDNIIYAGYQKKGERKYEKYTENGIVKERRKKNSDCLIVKSLFQGLYSLEEYEEMRRISKTHLIASVNEATEGLKNSLAGLVVCGKCGKIMQRQELRKKDRKTQVRFRCENMNCTNVSSDFYHVEDAVIDTMKSWLAKHRPLLDTSPSPAKKQDSTDQAIKRFEKEKDTLKKQLSRLHDLLEQGVYDTDTFLERNRTLAEKLDMLDQSIQRLHSRKTEEQKVIDLKTFMRDMETVVDIYETLESPEEKNRLLKTVLKKAQYTKETKGKGHERDFLIEIYPLVCK